MRAPSRPTAADPAQDAVPAGAPDARIRLYVGEKLAGGDTLIVSSAQSHYMANVMRRGPGDLVRLFNGEDGEHLATIVELKRDHGRLLVGGQLRPQAPEPDVWLAFALLKRPPTELIVQKATELGVSALMPLFTTRTNADRTKVDRLQAIAIEAAEQCERLTVPVVHPARALNAMLAAWPSNRRLVACLERVAAPSIMATKTLPASAPGGLLIGPEGGFTGEELDAVRAQPFVEVASLGPRILRADTAAIVGLALLQARGSSVEPTATLPDRGT